MEHIPAPFHDHIKPHLTSATLTDTTDPVDDIKTIQSDEEIELIKRTAVIQESAMENAITKIKPGMRDFEIIDRTPFLWQKVEGNYRCLSSTQCLHDVVVEDLLWNSFDGDVSEQRGKDRSSEDVLPQKGQIILSILSSHSSYVIQLWWRVTMQYTDIFAKKSLINLLSLFFLQYLFWFP